eukprot:SAG25_NODE_232_length_11380_cov_15.425583_5_plen_319_part_00
MPAATSACAIASSLETPRCVASKRRAWAHVQRALRAPRQQRVSAWLVPSIRPWPDTQQPAVAAHGGAFLSIFCSSSRYRFAAAGVESEGTAEADGGCWGDALGGDLYGTAMVGLSGRLPHPKLAALGVRWHLFVNAGSLVERYRPKNVAGRYIVRCVGVLAVCRFCDRAAHCFGRRGWQLLIAAAQSIVVVCACAWASTGGLAGRGVEADHTLARFARHVGVAAGGGLVFPTQLVSFTSVERPARGRRASSHFWCAGEDRAELSVASAAIAQSNDGGAHSLCAWCCQGCFLSLIVLAGGLARHRRAKPAFTICSRYLT